MEAQVMILIIHWYLIKLYLVNFMKIIFRFVLALGLFISCDSFAQGDIKFIVNSNTNYKIVIPKNSSIGELEASKTLQFYLNKISDARFLIITDDEKSEVNEILIGKTNRIVNVDYTKLAEDDTLIKTTDSKILLTGGNRKGVIYSIYKFLEKYVGIKKYTANFEFIPTKENLSLPSHTDDIDKPAFTYRMTDFKENYDKSYDDWNGLNYIFEERRNPVHSFFNYLPRTLFETHPDFFSLINGRRQLVQPCLSNPQVYKIIHDNLAKEMTKYPQIKIWSVSQMDNEEYCHCNLCEPKQRAGRGFVETLIPFVNKLAKDFPNKTISTLAYRQSIWPSLTYKPEKNIEIMLCFTNINRATSLKDGFTNNLQFSAPDNAKIFRQILESWQRQTSNIFAWDYSVNFTDTMSPFPNFSVLQPNIQFLREKKIPKIFVEGYGNQVGDFSELRSYLISKLLWNPYINFDATKKDFIYSYYGPAAPDINKYLELLEKNVLEYGSTVDIWADNSINKDDFLNDKNIQQYKIIFNSALKKVKKNEIYYNRVLKEYLSIKYAEIVLAKKNKIRMEKLGGKEVVDIEIEEIIRLAKKLGVEYFSYGHKKPEEIR